MKRLAISLFLILVCFGACKEMVDGGKRYEGIYMETAGGLINAHGYQIALPGEGGEFDYNLYGESPFSEDLFEGEYGIRIDFADEAYLVKLEGKSEEGYYRVSLHLTVPANRTGQVRSCNVKLYDVSYIDTAIMTITQESL